MGPRISSYWSHLDERSTNTRLMTCIDPVQLKRQRFQYTASQTFKQIKGYPAMSNACQEALNNLNSAFFNFMSSSLLALFPDLTVIKIAKAGSNPNGPLPAGYAPGN